MTCSWRKRPRRQTLLMVVALSLAASLAAIVPTAVVATAAPVAVSPTTAAAAPTDEQLAKDEAPIPKRCGPTPLNGCRLTWFGKEAPTLVVWGDSHMWMMTPAVKKAAAAKRVNLVLFFTGGCIPAIPDMKIYAGNPCAELSVDTMQYLQRLQASGRPFRLLIGAFWGANLNRIFWYEDQETIIVMKQRRAFTQKYSRPLFEWLGSEGIPTDVSFHGPISVPPSDCGRGSWPFWCPVNRTRAYHKDTYVRQWLARRMRHLPDGARLVDYSDGICSKSSCPAVVNGVHTWFDPYHVSATKAAKLASYYRPTVRTLVRGR